MAGLGLGLWAIFFACGCRNDNTDEVKTESQLSQLKFDAGVVFVDETNYVCIPFERLGLAPSCTVTSIKTSCQCVQGCVVSYVVPNKSIAHALKLDFVMEPTSIQTGFVPMRLTVQVTVGINGEQSSLEFEVAFVHTSSVPRHASTFRKPTKSSCGLFARSGVQFKEPLG